MKWLKSLAAAGIGAAASAFTATVVAPEIIAQLGWLPVLKMSGISGLIAMAGYLKKSPLPGVAEGE